jgi:cation:H+ antiporter
MFIQVILFLIGLALLSYGADLLVKNSSLLARTFGIKPIIVGLTLVAFGTSAPEFGVSFMAALTKSESIAIGNIVGSNIANIGLILGLASLFHPLEIEPKMLRREVPWVIGTAALLWFLSINGKIGWSEGIILLIFFALFLFYWIRKAVKGRTEKENKTSGIDAGKNTTRVSTKPKERLKRSILSVMGLGMLLGGGALLVRSAVNIAQNLGISELVIGLTIVSIGTSLPELATTVVAGLRKESGLGIGNIIGSNIFNTCWVIGCAVLVTTISVERISLRLDMPLMVVISVLLFLFFRSGLRISRFEGLLLLLLYFVYVTSRFVIFTQ